MTTCGSPGRVGTSTDTCRPSFSAGVTSVPYVGRFSRRRTAWALRTSLSADSKHAASVGASRPDQGFGFASLLLGTGSFQYEHVDPLTAYHHYLSGYVQDDFKVTKNLRDTAFRILL